MFSSSNLIILSLIGGGVTILFNMLGGLPVLFLKNISRKLLDIGLGFAAGVMLTASFTSLILPGIEAGGLLPVVIGIFLGVIMVSLADRLMPHLHAIIGYEGLPHPNLKLSGSLQLP